MSIDISVPGGNPNKPGFSVQRRANGLSISAGALADSPVMFGIARDENGLSANVLTRPSPPSLGPWTVYSFLTSGTFRLAEHAHIRADVLLVGGGGSGGGGSSGGGGGAGGFLDKHGVYLSAADNVVTVGAGGASLPYGDTGGNQGGDSSLGDLIAYGGGYGGGWWGGDGYYQASGGGSGGGGCPTGTFDREEQGIIYTHGDGGLSLHGAQGHWGHKGENASAWYRHHGGGGGGALWPGYGGDKWNGGLGLPCDIAGWYQLGGMMGQLYKEAGWRWIPWFAGGGAGAERPNLWSYPSGEPGYGGGRPNSGGGGGGAASDDGRQPGEAGFSGIVIIRIATSDEDRIEYPVPLGYEDIWDEWAEEWVHTPIMPEGITLTHLPPEQTHTDCMGYEPMIYWGWPDDHDRALPPSL